MLTERQQKLVAWLKKRKVATMKLMRHQFQVSHMTVFRALKKYGYLTSYNHNAAYYTLHDVPEFDEWGLWAHRDIRFSKFGSLTESIVALVQEAPGGMTVSELHQRLQTKVANLLCRLVQQGRLTEKTLTGRHVVYLAADSKQADRQQQRRQEMQASAAGPIGSSPELPSGLAANHVIEILRQMVLAPDAQPELLARQLTGRGVAVTAGQVRQVMVYYALEKKRLRWQ